MSQLVSKMRLNPSTFGKFVETLKRELPLFQDNTAERNAKFNKNKAGDESIMLAGYWGTKTHNVTVYFNYKVVFQGDLAEMKWEELMAKKVRAAK